jgi:argininosuccinate synthase
MDANLYHISYEGGVLEDPWAEPPQGMWRLTTDPRTRPTSPASSRSRSSAATPSPSTASASTPSRSCDRQPHRRRARRRPRRHRREPLRGHEVARLLRDPGGTLLHHAHKAIEQLTLDRQVMQLRDDLVPRYAHAVYDGFWYAPEREALQRTFDDIQRPVTGVARLKLYKGSVTILGRSSPNSLYRQDVVTFEADDVYHQGDADGFIKLNALRLRIAAQLARRVVATGAFPATEDARDRHARTRPGPRPPRAGVRGVAAALGQPRRRRAPRRPVAPRLPRRR